MADRESKHDRFRRLATQRTGAVLHRLEILGHCANPQLYEYSEEDVRRVFRAIEAEVRAVKAKFTSTSKSRFSL